MDGKNVGISNRETQWDNCLKVMGFYNLKAELYALFAKYVLDTSFQWRIGYSDKKR